MSLRHNGVWNTKGSHFFPRIASALREQCAICLGGVRTRKVAKMEIVQALRQEWKEIGMVQHKGKPSATNVESHCVDCGGDANGIV